MSEHLVDIEYIKHCHGLFVGLLSDNEIAAFNRLCDAGLARRVYEGVGLAKVQLMEQQL